MGPGKRQFSAPGVIALAFSDRDPPIDVTQQDRFVRRVEFMIDPGDPTMAI
ncbi:hypothetical protein VSX64_24990 [Aurantimonas sp. C2-6-R+9]|uniref:hypothetical protein n=1 Tax=unclassified Aurantimonas TaxID=2638230 RepID=UPI002E18E1CA|nr:MULTISPECIES: hypothetical protein [unclassified Aurantimonas]MEC5293766.1 hypothetical protein [Aurantimonas sp. C2-3-R2]MEC5383954.1 hypothetical protein [Aurantimonas sp. C2-6-R+9]MEC5414830.1 hypothetical protein [Aurantimonas sp. C2-4-R8]